MSPLLTPTYDDAISRKQAILIFQTLSSPVRLDVFELLVRHEPQGLVAGQTGAVLQIPATNLCFHLKALRQAGLLLCVQEGRSLRYRARTRLAHKLAQFYTCGCCSASASPCSPHSHEEILP